MSKLIKVQATQDGVYGGYYRYGPHLTEEGPQAGDVFTIDAEPKPVLDDNGKPVQDMIQTGEINPSTGLPILRPAWVLDGNGKPKKDAKGNLIPKIRMATAFAAEWMVPVNDDATVTHPEQETPAPILPEYRPGAKAKPNVAARPAHLPKDIQDVLEGKSSESVI